MATLKELEDGIKRLNDDLQALKAKQNSKRWVPGHGEIYYYIDSALDVVFSQNNNFDNDKNRILVGNCYKTQAEAEKERDRIVAIAEVNQIIREENGDWVPDWSDSNQQKRLLCYDYSDKSMGTFLSFKRKLHSELDYCCVEVVRNIISRITQDQIKKIWRL